MTKIEHCSGILPLQKMEGKWQVLLALHVKGSYWAFPKGHYAEEESPKDGAIRELFEETNLTIESFIDAPSLEEDYLLKRQGQEIRKYVEYFPAMVKGDLLLKEPHEIKELKWFFLDEAFDVITFDQSKLLLQDFIKTINP